MDMADDKTDTPAPEPEETDATPSAPTEAAAPEAPAEETDATPSAATEVTEPEAAAEPEPEPAPAAPKPEPVAQLTASERKIAARERRGKRRPSTPEERLEARKVKAASRSRHRATVKAKREKAGVKGEGTPPADPGDRSAKVRTGKVVSAKADKTITVKIESARRHRRYQKIVRSSATLHAHDETNDANEGDLVRVIETRPMSALKRWRLTEVLERAK
jgi:small subunit ribosomal protein S17